MPVMLVTKEYFAHDFCFEGSAYHLVFKKASSFRNWTSSTSQVNVCGQCYRAALHKRSHSQSLDQILCFLWIWHNVKVQETINSKCRADSFYVSEIRCSYLIFSVLVPYSADGSNPGYPQTEIFAYKREHVNNSALSYALISNFLI